MNPQYAAQSQFGGAPPQYPPNRSTPSPASQGFQQIPLGPQKPAGPPFPGAQPPNFGAPGSQYPPNMRSAIPPDQRPPSGPGPNQFGPPPSDIKTMGVQNGPPQINNGAGFGMPPTSAPLPPQGQLPPTNKLGGGSNQPSNLMRSQGSFPGQPPMGNQHSLPNHAPLGGMGNLPPPPGAAQQGSQPPPMGQPTINQHPTMGQLPSNQHSPMGQPPLNNQPPPIGQSPINQHTPMGQPPLNNQPSPMGQPPLNNQPPPMGQPPLSNQPQPMGQPPINQHPPMGQPPINNQPPTMGQPPVNQHPPIGQPPVNNQPPPMGQPPINQHPPMGQPPVNNQPPPMGQPPINQQPPMGQPTINNQPPTGGNNLPPQQVSNRNPPFAPLANQAPNQPPFPGQPPLNRPQSDQPPFPGQPPLNQARQPALPNQPFLNQPLPTGAQPPFPGQPPMGGARQPPLPGQPPMPGQAFNNAPYGGGLPPNRQQPGPNQLSNQMQGMNLNGPGQYPGGPPMAVNGDNGPHMLPQMNQQQYMNGQQMRAAPGPGYPPIPGQQPAAMGGYPQPAYQQPQQVKRLDPDQMPSPIQVTQDDQQNRSGLFCTNAKGLVPPLVTTNFVVQDQGNASPRLIRSTMYNVPISNDIMKQTSVPFSLVISPMARPTEQEYSPPIVNFGDLGPVRCIRCKAYMCPFMQFIDSGRRFQCLFCKATTDVPNEYFQHLDHTGQRLDRMERPELLLGTYEFVATTDYCRNNTLPKPPAIIFVIDVSYNNIKSGLVHLLCSQMKEIIQHLPIDEGQEKSNMRVGFITYNSSVHFYNIKGNLAAPQMLIVGDTQEMFMPLLDGFLCTPEESGPVIDALMEQIPTMFEDTRETETILLPAVLAGLEALKASDTTGKLLVFHSTLPTAEAPGKLKSRDDRKLLATDKERTILTPQNVAYNQLGQDCVGSGCSVDLFLFNNAYIDVATIGQVSRLTGGEVFKYTYFQADIDGERLVHDVITDISRPIAFDGIMRVRTSTGVRPTDFYGHFYMSNTTDMELAAIDCDKAVAIEIKHDDKLSEEEGVYIQAALLYTSCSGQRRLRIINLSLKTCSQMADLYRSCDCDTIINYMAKQSVYKLLEHNPKAVKDNIMSRAAQILATYRKNCASPSSAGQLILPECMKLLPLYVNCLLKSDALAGGADMTVDDRSFVMQQVMIMDIPTSVNYFYPRMISLTELDVGQEQVEVPPSIRCTVDKMNEQGVYILENGIHMFMWIGLGASPDFVQNVFGAPSAIQVDIERTNLPELDNPLSAAVRSIVEEIRVQRHRYMRLTIVRQREKLEPVFKHFLAEDRGNDGSPSYVDFLIHVHKEIRSLLS